MGSRTDNNACGVRRALIVALIRAEGMLACRLLKRASWNVYNLFKIKADISLF